MKVVLTVICNDMSTDVFTSDGNYYDRNKFHDYSYYPNLFTVLEEGEWTTTDGGITWHVSQLLIQDIRFGGYSRYSFDVRFDGDNYLCENGFKDGSNRLNWLRAKSDPSKYSEDDLSNIEINTFCIVSPKQIGE